MGLDTSSPAVATDNTAAAVSNANVHSPLARLQEGAGLQDKISQAKNPDVSGDFFKEPFDGGKIPDRIIRLLSGKDSPPTDKERSDAEQSLEGRMSKLTSEGDREAMKAMTTAITNGDAKAFGEAIKKAGGDPQKLKALVEEVNRLLEDKGSTTRLDITADGKVLVSDTCKNPALAFDPKTGTVEAKAVEHNPDGSILVKPGELLHVDTGKVFKEMGDRAVDSINQHCDSPIWTEQVPGGSGGPGIHWQPRGSEGGGQIGIPPIWPELSPGHNIPEGRPVFSRRPWTEDPEIQSDRDPLMKTKPGP